MEIHERRLPHYYAIGHPIFLTWRLYGSLPGNRVFPQAMPSGRAFVAMDRLLDRGRTGPLYLARPEIANVVMEALLFREKERHFTLHAWVVMSNHVHLLMTPNVDVSAIMQSMKRFTARECNRLLNRTGEPFWMEESYDRLVRGKSEFNEITDYIEMNPVKAGLAETPEAFPYSSARPIANRPRVTNPPHHRFC